MSIYNIVHGYPEDFSSLGMITYALCENGIYLIRKSGNGVIVTKESGIKGLSSGPKDEVVNTILKRKIPFDVYFKTVSFFRAVMERFKQDALEAFILILYNREKDLYKLYVPEHKVSAGSVSYDISEVWRENPGYKVVLDIHSHHNMGAFFSGTDDKDDNRDRFSAVIGKISKIFPDFKVRFSTLGKHQDLELDDVFENISSEKVDLDIEDSLSKVSLISIKKDKSEKRDSWWNGRSYSPRAGNDFIDGVSIPRSGYSTAGIFRGYRRHIAMGSDLTDIDSALGD